jgi:hypothetical protein
MLKSFSTTNVQAQKGLNSNHLKLIAIAAMTIDHLTWTLMPGFDQRPLAIFLHCIGRITAPIMFYFIAEGYYHTKDLKKYIFRLFGFSVVSHFAYVICFGGTLIPFQSGRFSQTSVIWPLMWGLIALAAVKSDNSKLKPALKVIIVIVCCIIAAPADWSFAAPLAIVLIGINKGNFKKQMLGMIIPVALYSAGYASSFDMTYGLVQMAVVLSIPFLYFYNGQRGEWKSLKWIFYIYYPLHMFILGWVRIFVLR